MAREGAVAGVIGAAVVAVWFLVCDIVAGEIFRTPALLGAAAFLSKPLEPLTLASTVRDLLGTSALTRQGRRSPVRP